MDKSQFSYRFNIRIFSDEKFFGAGVCQLLELVDETKSLLQASKKMNMAYTKALKIIKRAEDVLGYKLLNRQTGGKEGGGSHLTSNAKTLIKIYRQFERNVKASADKEFEILINEMGKLS